MKITILGSGTSTGVPMVGCLCPVCASTDPRDVRTRASILIEISGRFILVDTSPDLRRQALREKIPHIDAVLYTHTHADHVNGIDDLRGYYLMHRRAVPCYATAEIIDHLSRHFSYIFSGSGDGGYKPLLEAHSVSGKFNLYGSTIQPVPLVHGCGRATGYRIDNVAYLTDCNRIPESSMALLSGLDTLILDGLRYKPHPNHFNIQQAIKITEQLRPRRTILTHLTHEVSHTDESRLPEGVFFAYDGMIIE